MKFYKRHGTPRRGWASALRGGGGGEGGVDDGDAGGNICRLQIQNNILS